MKDGVGEPGAWAANDSLMPNFYEEEIVSWKREQVTTTEYRAKRVAKLRDQTQAKRLKSSLREMLLLSLALLIVRFLAGDTWDGKRSSGSCWPWCKGSA